MWISCHVCVRLQFLVKRVGSDVCVCVGVIGENKSCMLCKQENSGSLISN